MKDYANLSKRKKSDANKTAKLTRVKNAKSGGPVKLAAQKTREKAYKKGK